MKNLIFAFILALSMTQLSFAERGQRGGGEDSYGNGDGQQRERGEKRGKRGKRGGKPMQAIIKFMENDKIPADAKAELVKEFKSFQEKSYKLRLDHEKKLYGIRKENMEKMHMERLQRIEDRRKMISSLDLTDATQIKAHQKKMKEEREKRKDKKKGHKEQREQMKKLRGEFKEKMKEMAKSFRAKMKSIASKYRK